MFLETFFFFLQGSDVDSLNIDGGFFTHTHSRTFVVLVFVVVLFRAFWWRRGLQQTTRSDCPVLIFPDMCLSVCVLIHVCV